MTFVEFAEHLGKEAARRTSRKTAKKGWFEKFVHHPLTQAVGYGTLAAEGPLAVAHEGHLGPRARKVMGSKWGTRLGLANLGIASGFLGLEGAAALRQLMRQSKKKRR